MYDSNNASAYQLVDRQFAEQRGLAALATVFQSNGWEVSWLRSGSVHAVITVVEREVPGHRN